MFYRGFSGSIAKVFLRESLIAGGEVAFTRPAIASWRKSVGLDYTWNDFLLEVGTATAAGGFFGVGVKGTISGIKALRKAGTRIPKNIEAEINKGEMDLEDAIKKLTYNPAKTLKIKNRGLLKKGYYADIKFRNNSTKKAHLFSIGSEVVLSSK